MAATAKEVPEEPESSSLQGVRRAFTRATLVDPSAAKRMLPSIALRKRLRASKDQSRQRKRGSLYVQRRKVTPRRSLLVHWHLKNIRMSIRRNPDSPRRPPVADDIIGETGNNEAL
ncbi:MAG: hypothetical protein Q9201_000824 [Fulgogasparrea decipioides]